MAELFYRAVKKYIPQKFDIPAHSDELTINNLQRINPKPGGDGTAVPAFWKKVDKVFKARKRA